MTPSNTCVWFEIPVSDLDRARTFYSAVLKRDMARDDQGPNPMVMFAPMNQPGVGGHLYPGKAAAPGTGPTIHLASPDDLADVAQRVRNNGGKVVTDVIEIPAGRFFYATDPDGNSIGLFAS